jgi:hypothetical protein
MSTESDDQSSTYERVSRRAVLALLTTTAAGSAGAWFLMRGREALHLWERETLARLSRHLAFGKELDVLGPAAIEALDEDRPGELAEYLFRARDQFRGRDGEGALDLLRDQVRADYAAGRTLLVGKWELSQTEARLFAVLYQARGKPLA